MLEIIHSVTASGGTEASTNDMTFGIGADFAQLMQHVLADLSEAIGLAPTDIRLSRLSL